MYALNIHSASKMTDAERELAIDALLKVADGKIFTGTWDGHKGRITAYVADETKAYATAFDIETSVPFRVEVVRCEG